MSEELSIVDPPDRSGGGAVRGWSLSLYPTAGEAGGSWLSGAGRREPSRGGVPDPERSAAEAARRARGQIRRYGAANGLNRLGTLTYAGPGCQDERESSGGTWPSSSGRCAPSWASERSRICGCRSGRSPVTASTPISLSVSSSPAPRSNRLGAEGSCTSGCCRTCPAGPGGSKNPGSPPGIWLSTSVRTSAVAGPGLHRYEVAQGFAPEVVRFTGCGSVGCPVGM